ncbi:alpha/beta fold hydrolase [Ramlibacter sp. PS4R-6]|uniref:alpha/beta fold hydrolase n=1 Tax=Ramlibacter sp. PS4R-6 TaxID=3133438 RepID=UPI003096B4B3
MSGHPVVFEAAGASCLGWFHAAQGARRRVAVVLCRPLGYEALCSYRTYTQLAHTLAAAGFDVLRFDYQGSGDSAGGDTDAGRVDAWLASIAAAVAQARHLAGTDEVALFGMRLGATLAMEAAQRMGGVGSLMLWAPCPSGRAFAREMRAAFGSHAQASQLAGGVEALGTLFTPETLAAIERLAPDRAPARRVLVIARDDMPGEGPLPARLRAQGADVTATVWPGYADMMAEPHDAKLAPETLQSITDWLCAAHPVADNAHAPAAHLAWPTGWHAGGAIETPLSFGADGRLFGVLSQPSAAALAEHAGTAVLLLNVGGNYRVGPNRVYVKLARELAAAGYRVLRMDVTGIGDSRIEEGFSSDSMYRSDAVADVGAAIDLMHQRGCQRIFLLGICSGAYLAFQTALQDARVNGQMIINARLLEWDAEKNGPWQTSMQQYYKSTRYYKQKLLSGEVYARVLRGEVDVSGIAKRFIALGAARLRRGIDRLLGRAPQEGVLAKMKHLAGRGVQTLVAMSEEDDGLDYVEFHLGSRGARMRGHPNFRMVLIEEADHTFSTVASQRGLLDAVRQHLDAVHEPAAAPRPVPGLAEPAAT